MSAKKCVLCEGSTANELVVHETCHDQLLTEYRATCHECERNLGECDRAADYDRVVHELRLRWLPNYRAMAVA